MCFMFKCSINSIQTLSDLICSLKLFQIKVCLVLTVFSLISPEALGQGGDDFGLGGLGELK